MTHEFLLPFFNPQVQVEPTNDCEFGFHWLDLIVLNNHSFPFSCGGDNIDGSSSSSCSEEASTHYLLLADDLGYNKVPWNPQLGAKATTSATVTIAM